MYARVVRMEGVDPDTLRSFGEFVSNSSGPPDGVPSVGFTLLIDREKGTGLGIGFFKTEEDLRTGDEVLRQMDSPIPGMPSPTWVESYEVAVERRL